MEKSNLDYMKDTLFKKTKIHTAILLIILIVIGIISIIYKRYALLITVAIGWSFAILVSFIISYLLILRLGKKFK